MEAKSVRWVPFAVAAAVAGFVGLVPAVAQIRTFAGGSADGASPLISTFAQPWSARRAPDGGATVVDSFNHRIRHVDPLTRHVLTVAGSGDEGFAGDGGPATAASLNFPMGAAYGPDGSLYFTDHNNDRVRKVDAQTGVITTVAGTGPNFVTYPDYGGGCPPDIGDGAAATAACVGYPIAVAVDAGGNVFVTEWGNSRLRRVDAATGIINTVAQASAIAGLALDAFGNPIFNGSNYRLYYLNLLDVPVTIYPQGPEPVTVAPHTKESIAGGDFFDEGGTGDGGPATRASIDYTNTLEIAANGDVLLTEGNNWSQDVNHWVNLVRRIDWRTGTIRTVAGEVTVGGYEALAASTFIMPSDAFEGIDGALVVLDTGTSRLRRVNPATGSLETEAGVRFDGTVLATRGQLLFPRAVAAGPRGIYIADDGSTRVYRVDPDGLMRSIAGALPEGNCLASGPLPACVGGQPFDSGPASEAGLSGRIDSLAVSPQSLVAVVWQGAVRVINDDGQPMSLFGGTPNPLTLPSGWLATIAGGGAVDVPQSGSIDATTTRLSNPRDVAFAQNGDLLITEGGAERILRLDMNTGQISVLTGRPRVAVPNPLGGGGTIRQPVSYLDGPLATAQFSAPVGIAAAPDGTTIYVADSGNNVIRKIDLGLGLVTTFAGAPGFVDPGFGGDGLPALVARFALPWTVRVGPDGSVYVMDWGNQRVRKITPDGFIDTVAGSGPSFITGPLDNPYNCSDYGPVPCGHFTGDWGPATSAQINMAFGLDVDFFGNLYIADTGNARVRVVDSGRSPNHPPAAVLLADTTSGMAPLTVQLDASGSADPDPGDWIDSYTLDFGDGSPAVRQAGSILTHVFSSSGTFTATLQATDVHGLSNTNTASVTVNVTTPPNVGLDFYTATPCRILDTRQTGTPLQGAVASTLTLRGSCGIPATGKAVSLNLTVLNATADGSLVFYPAGSAPQASAISFTTGKTRANNAVVSLASDGTTQALATLQGAGQIDLVVDVNGWFE